MPDVGKIHYVVRRAARGCFSGCNGKRQVAARSTGIGASPSPSWTSASASVSRATVSS